MAELFGSDSDEEAGQPGAAGPGLSAREAAAAAKKGFWTGEPSGSKALQGVGGRAGAGKAAGKLAVAPRLAAEAGSRGGKAERAEAGSRAGEQGDSALLSPRRVTADRQSSVPEAVRQRLAAQVRSMGMPLFCFACPIRSHTSVLHMSSLYTLTIMLMKS
jgi:hypothetical protein